LAPSASGSYVIVYQLLSYPTFKTNTSQAISKVFIETAVVSLLLSKVCQEGRKRALDMFVFFKP